jgi:hypothetical protein
LPAFEVDSPDDRWRLDHAADGVGYLGPAHASCNLRAAGKVRAAQLYGKPVPKESSGVSRWSRHWYGGFDERCRECRELGEACEAAARTAPGPVGTAHRIAGARFAPDFTGNPIAILAPALPDPGI